ncbi:MAG: type IV pilus assembly protein PilW [Candidatus Electronema aureum]|uniref:Type IV pilus assembly protein PilW n=1 Tax=Candidatus Electronema aureum TaxID=2005002 RepID=A0A521G337_9BACT|nr:MAG: type IV pilus assembly protein PilW [Candidatus Electronema aureum]
MKKKPKKNGFTLIEIMVSMAISSMVIGGIYGVYTIQQRSYTVQEQVTEMQQKLRSVLDFMNRDIRMAGYDPGGVCRVNKDNGGILIKKSQEFFFEYCDRDSTTNQWVLNRVMYSINNNNLDRNLTLINIGTGVVGPGQTRTIAEGVDGIEFLYLQGNGTPPPEATNIADTRIVRLSILIRASYPDPRHTDTTQYIPSSGTAWASLNNGSSNPPNDHFHRRLLVTSIELRNVGL